MHKVKTTTEKISWRTSMSYILINALSRVWVQSNYVLMLFLMDWRTDKRQTSHVLKTLSAFIIVNTCIAIKSPRMATVIRRYGFRLVTLCFSVTLDQEFKLISDRHCTTAGHLSQIVKFCNIKNIRRATFAFVLDLSTIALVYISTCTHCRKPKCVFDWYKCGCLVNLGFASGI